MNFARVLYIIMINLMNAELRIGILVWVVREFLRTRPRKPSILHRELLRSLLPSPNPVAAFLPHRSRPSPVNQFNSTVEYQK